MRGAHIATALTLLVTSFGVPNGALAKGHRLAVELLVDCTAGSGDPSFRSDRRRCDDYLAGIYDLMFARKSADEEACVPRDMTADRLRQVVVRYLRGHAADLSFSAAVAVRSAASEAWPRCSLG